MLSAFASRSGIHASLVWQVHRRAEQYRRPRIAKREADHAGSGTGFQASSDGVETVCPLRVSIDATREWGSRALCDRSERV